MPDNVEMRGLEFKITDDSTAAVRSLENLRNTLQALKTATSGGITGVSRVATQISQLNNALQGLNTGNVADKLARIASGLRALQGVSEVRISSSIANQISALTAAAERISPDSAARLSSLANGLRPLGQLGRANLTSFINQLRRLPDVIEQLERADLDRFTEQMRQLADALRPLADEIARISNGFSNLPENIRRLLNDLQRLNGQRNQSDSSLSLFGGFKLAGAYLTIRQIADWISTAITKSNEYQENLNLFTVAMGEYAQEAYDYGQTVSNVLGIDFSEWIRNQGIFNTLLTGFGNTADRAAIMSKNLTQLGYDLSSFFNIAVEDAMQKLQSGISGELEPLRRLGFDLSQARLEAEALALGIDKSVMSMTQAEKAELRYYAIMTQVTTAQGDLARTLESPANQLRILQAQFTMAAQSVGNIFIPALNAILPYAIAVVKVLREIANAVASLFGFQLTEVDYSGVSGSIGDAAAGAGDLSDNLGSAAGAAAELKKYVAGFDELNILPDQSSGGGAGGTGADAGGGFDFKLPEYDFLGDAINTKVDEITKKLEPLLKFIRENAEDILDVALDIGKAVLAWAIAKKFLTNLHSIVDYFKQGREELSVWDRFMRGITGVIVLSVGLNWSFDAGFDIGRGEASIMSYIKAILGPIAAGIGGALIGSAIAPGVGTGIGFAIGVGLGIIFEVAGYFEGKEAAAVVDEFSRQIANGKTSVEEFSIAAAAAFRELSGGAATIAQYGVAIDEQTSKIDRAKLGIDTYVSKWGVLGSLTGEEISELLSNLDLLVTASEEKLNAASAALSSTLVMALQDATAETKNTYNGLLEMIFLLEADGNTTVAGWKQELYEAERALAALDETSATYEQDSQALMDKIFELTNKIYGLDGASVESASSFEKLASSITGLDFSALTDPSGTAKTALEELTAAASTAYEDTRSAYDTNIKSLDELFAYVDTNSASWKAVYQNALDLGLDESTLVTDKEAIKEFMAGYFAEIYESQIAELDSLFGESYGKIAEFLTESLSAAAMATDAGKLATNDRDWWANMMYGMDYQYVKDGLGGADRVAAIADEIDATWQGAISEAAEILKEDDTYAPLFDALEESASAVESSRALAVSGTNMGEAITGGVTEGLTSPTAKGLLDAGFGSLAALVDQYGMDAIDAHSPAKLTIPHGEYITAGLAKGLTDDTAKASIDAGTQQLASVLSESLDTALGKSDIAISVDKGEYAVSGLVDGLTGETAKTEIDQGAKLVASTLSTALDNALGKTAGESIALTKAKTFMSDFANGISQNTSPINSAMDSMLNSLLYRMETFTNRLRSALNSMLSDFRSSMASVSVSSAGRVSYTPSYSKSIPRFANGGFVDQGQLFIAREAGAEMVGSIGRKTAVANNDQIVSGISDGVSTANMPVVAAINTLIRVVQDKEFAAYMDGRQVTKSQNNRNRMYGKTLQNV